LNSGLHACKIGTLWLSHTSNPDTLCLTVFFKKRVEAYNNINLLKTGCLLLPMLFFILETFLNELSSRKTPLEQELEICGSV
jgi:hypothetical protein